MFAFTNRQIEVFLTVCEIGSVSRAADHLYVSEASISHHVRSLEQQIGIELFRRSRGEKISLTSEGELFHKNAIEFVRFGRMLGRRTPAKSTRQLTLRVAVGRLLLEQCIRPALADFVRLHPNINFSFITDMSRAEIREALKSGELEGALVALTNRRHLPRSTFVSTVKVGLFGNSEMVRRAQSGRLSELPFLLCDPNVVEKKDQLKLLHKIGVKNPIFSGTYQFPNEAVAMAIGGRGAVALLDKIVEEYDSKAELKLIRRLPNWERRLFLQAYVDKDLSDIVTKFFIDSTI